jgi:hypothetical protein
MSFSGALGFEKHLAQEFYRGSERAHLDFAMLPIPPRRRNATKVSYAEGTF